MRKKKYSKRILENWELYVFMLLPIIYMIIFKYWPMFGIQIAFKKFNIVQGIWGSPWIGFKHFQKFVNSTEFFRILKNTLVISIYSLLAGFPMPIIMALCLNYVDNKHYKKIVQMITYAPHFISVVVMVGLILQFLNPRYGLVNNFINLFNGKSVNFMASKRWFSSIYVWSGVWQNVGYGSIIYLAVLAGIDPQLHESAIIDGATKLQRMWYIDLPGILPTAVILLIMNTGNILNVGFEKILLMQNPMNLQVLEVIDTFVYKRGLASNYPNFSYATAIGLFKSVIGLALLSVVNGISKRVSETSLW